MVEVDLTLLVVGQRITENSQFIVLDMFLQVLAYQFVQYVSEDALTVHFLYEASRNHSRTETRHLRLVTHFFQLLCNFLLIISRLQGQSHYGHQVFQFTLFNFHDV